MTEQIKLSKPMQWFIKIGMGISIIIGHINVLNTADKGGWIFVMCVCIQLWMLLYGFWLIKFMDE
jgi:hypothetical protein